MARMATRAALSVFCFVLASASVCNAAYQGPDRSKLRIGAYFLRTKGGVTEEHVRDLKDCGIDFVFDRFNAKSSRAEYDLYAKYGIGAVVTWVIPGKQAEPGTMAEKVPLTVYEEVSRRFRAQNHMHRVIEAMAIGDEPSAVDFPYMGQAIESAKRAFPECMIYLNLYPNYAFRAENTAEQMLAQLGAASYREYIDKYCQHIPLDYISYDFYLYSRKNEDFIAKYYDNLLVVADACRRTNRSLWLIPQVNSCSSNLWISANKLRFQANSSMAFGAESIAWSCYAPGWWKNNVLTPEGEKTQQYEKLKTVNAELHRVGSRYMLYKNAATHFVGFPADCADLAGLPVKPVESLAVGSFASIRAEDGGKLIVGEMVARKGGGGDAIFVCAADDPYDKANRKRTIRFRVKDGCDVRATGGNGPVALEKSADGTYAFQMSSSAGVLVEASSVAALSLATGTKTEISFAPGAWNSNDWIIVKSPGKKYVHGFVQRADGIENECPDLSGEEIHKKHFNDVYSAMVLKDRVEAGQTVSSAMSFDWRMAPLIVLAGKIDESETGVPIFGDHWEVVLYAEGLNVWRHSTKDGKPFVYRAAYLKVPFNRNTRYNLEVKVAKTSKGLKEMTVKCCGHEIGYVDNDLPDSFHAGIIGCEGRNRFYDFKVK